MSFAHSFLIGALLALSAIGFYIAVKR